MTCRSCNFTSVVEFPEFVGYVKAALEVLGVDKFTAVGNLKGFAIAQELAAQSPSQVSAALPILGPVCHCVHWVHLFTGCTDTAA